MKKQFTFQLQTLVLVTAIIAFLVGCVDPQQQAIKILSKQGLVAVLPARDYIKPGGLVVLAGSHPSYIDPLDDIPPTSVADFKSILPAQSFKDSTGLDAGLKAIGSLLPLSLQANSNDSVTFGQIDTEGTRLESPKVDAIIQATNTRAKALEQLHGNRVFIVQEVYAGKAMNVTSTSSKSLNVSYGNSNGKPADCTLPAGTQKPGSADPSKPGTTQATPTQPAAPSKPGTTQAKPAQPAAPSKPGTTQATPTQPAAPSLSASIGVCHATDGSLSFTATSPIVFAVRLNELKNDKGVLKVIYGNVHFSNSLGDPELEKRTSMIKPSDPVIHSLEPFVPK